MELSPEIIQLGQALTNVAGKQTVSTIMDKITSIKSTKDKDKIISKLEEIISDLIEDKNQLIQIARAYEEQLIVQRISSEDILYITDSLVPVLENLLEHSEGEEKAKEALGIMKPLLSKEIFNILQLLGFNFKQAIGEPLTQLVNALIISQMPAVSDKEVNREIINQQIQLESIKVVQNKEAFERFERLMGHNQ